MPKPGKYDHTFKNLTARWYVPRVIYFDLESLLLPVYGPQTGSQKPSTQTFEVHQPWGYALAVIEIGKKYLLKFELKRGPKVMEELINSLESLARQIYVKKRKHYTFFGITDQERDDAFGLLDMRERFFRQWSSGTWSLPLQQQVPGLGT